MTASKRCEFCNTEIVRRKKESRQELAARRYCSTRCRDDARAPGVCNVEGCNGTHSAKGYCRIHYRRLTELGSLHLKPRPTAEERFWSNIAPAAANECWLWTGWGARGGGKGDGYGRFYLNGRVELAHRVAYRFLVAEIPDGLSLDHLCRTPACVNPWHLDPVTHTVNVRRGMSAQKKDPATLKKACHKGHPFTAENTAYNRNGSRRCRTCSAVNWRRAELRRKGRRRVKK